MDTKKSQELISLNSQLPKFFIEELEERLETDPLMLGGLLDLASGDSEAPCFGYGSCKEKDGDTCGTEEHCGWY